MKTWNDAQTPPLMSGTIILKYANGEHDITNWNPSYSWELLTEGFKRNQKAYRKGWEFIKWCYVPEDDD